MYAIRPNLKFIVRMSSDDSFREHFLKAAQVLRASEDKQRVDGKIASCVRQVYLDNKDSQTFKDAAGSMYEEVCAMLEDIIVEVDDEDVTE